MAVKTSPSTSAITCIVLSNPLRPARSTPSRTGPSTLIEDTSSDGEEVDCIGGRSGRMPCRRMKAA